MRYPQYDRQKYTVWALPHPMVLVTFLNPLMFFNELILGQRTPKVTLVDNTLDSPFMERIFVPCPSCGELHDQRLWERSNVYGHWFGYVCPSCGKIIPCLWSLSSWVILIATSPLWFLPAKFFQESYIEYEKTRYENVQILSHEEVPWMRMGALWAILMWIVLWLIPNLCRLSSGSYFHPRDLAVSLVIAVVSAFAFGFMNKLISGERPKRNRRQ